MYSSASAPVLRISLQNCDLITPNPMEPQMMMLIQKASVASGLSRTLASLPNDAAQETCDTRPA